MLCIPVGHLYYDTMCCALLYCFVSAHALLQPAVVQRKQCSSAERALCCSLLIYGLHVDFRNLQFWCSLLLSLHELPCMAVLLPPHSFATESDGKLG